MKKIQTYKIVQLWRSVVGYLTNDNGLSLSEWCGYMKNELPKHFKFWPVLYVVGFLGTCILWSLNVSLVFVVYALLFVAAYVVAEASCVLGSSRGRPPTKNYLRVLMLYRFMIAGFATAFALGMIEYMWVEGGASGFSVAVGGFSLVSSILWMSKGKTDKTS